MEVVIPFTTLMIIIICLQVKVRYMKMAGERSGYKCEFQISKHGNTF